MESKRASVVPLVAALMIAALLRIPFLRVSVIAMAVAQAVLAFLMCKACQNRRWIVPFLQAVLPALAMWALDLCDGPAAIVRGAAWVTLAWAIRRFCSKRRLLNVLGWAFAARVAGLIGTMLIVVMGREHLSLGSGFIYAAAQQAVPFAAELVGCAAMSVLTRSEQTKRCSEEN